MNFEQLNGITIKQGFEKFHAENPRVFDLFVEQVNLALKRGKKKLSAKMIINWIRWNVFLETTDKHFKINDAYQSYYAREFAKRNPHLSNIFEFRKLRNE
ncbi:MAG: hypothetical protein RLY43_1444 [Bacteroidota bacterium]